MDRVYDRCLDEPAEHRAERSRVVVDHVELVGPLVAREHVAQLRQRAADLIARRVLEDRLELRLRTRVARREQRHLVAVVREAVGEQPDDPLDPAVAGGRHREPGRSQDSDSQCFLQ